MRDGEMKKLIVLLSVTILVIGLISTVSAVEPKGKFALSAKGGIAKFTGDAGDAFKMGFGGGIGAEYFVIDNLSVGGSFQYNTFKFKESDEEKALIEEAKAMIAELEQEIADETDPVLKAYLEALLAAAKEELTALEGEMEGSVKLMPFGVYGKYYIPMEGKLAPYFMGGVGAYRFSNGDSETKMGINFGAGGKYSINEKVGILVEGAYHIIFTEEESTKYFDVKAGVIFYLGGTK
jgi:opacity protein-like surface antigen